MTEKEVFKLLKTLADKGEYYRFGGKIPQDRSYLKVYLRRDEYYDYEYYSLESLIIGMAKEIDELKQKIKEVRNDNSV